MAAELHDEARALIARLRTPRVTHHQVSDDWEPYKTVAKTHALDPVRVEAADMIERLLAALGVLAVDPAQAFTEPGKRRWSRVMKAMNEAMERAVRAFAIGTADDYSKACIAFDDALAAELDRVTAHGVRVDAMSQTLTVAELAKRSGVKSLTVMERIKEWGGGDVTLNQPINLIGLATAALAHGMEGRKP